MRLLALIALACLLPAAHAAEDVVEARVGGDRFVAGGSVRQSRPVEGDLLAVGGDVRLEASVGSDARLAGGNVTLAADARVEGNLLVAGGSVEIRGPVGGNVHVAGGDVLVDSAVAGDVTVAAGELTLGPDARIGGKVRHHGRLNRDPGATVGGGIERGRSRVIDLGRSHERGSRWGGALWTLGLVTLAAILVAAFPAGSRRVGEMLRGDPAMALLLGFVTLVCVPVAALILAITIIGIPLAIVLALLYFVVLLVGYCAMAVVIGDAALAKLRARDASSLGWRVAAAMAATVAIAIASRIPLLGGLVVFAILMAGLGAILLALRAYRAGGPATTPA